MIRQWDQLFERGPGCWNWIGTIDPKGYGRWWNGRRSVAAHRVVFEKLIGPIEEGKTLDHLCRNRRCVRPDHLEVVTSVENVMRGESLPAQNARKDACDNGHPFTEENTYIHPGDGFRYCRQCRKERSKARRDRDAEFLAKRPDYEAAVDALDLMVHHFSPKVVENAIAVLRRLRGEG